MMTTTMRYPSWLGLGLTMLFGCADKVPPKPPPSPTVDLVAHNATRAVVRDASDEPASSMRDGASRLVLPEARDVVVVQVERLIGLELNPLVLMMARRYVEDDCLAGNLLRVERVTVSRDGEGWIAAAEGDDLAREVFACAEGGTAEDAARPVSREIAGRPATSLGFDLMAVADDGVLFVGEEASLRRLSRPRDGQASALLDALPGRDDSLLELSSRSDIGNAPAASTGYVAGTLDRMTLHAESEVQDSDLVQLVTMLPMLKVALRPALERALGKGPEAELVLELIDDLEIDEKGDRIIVDLAVDDVRGLLRRLWPDTEPSAQR